jgi:hypothetical protein
VNPDALKHLIAGTTARYVVEGRFGPGRGAIEYLADWVGIARWIANDPISREFELVVEDAALNLGVLQRVGAR